MALNLQEQQRWADTIRQLKKNHPEYHYFYSSIEGWCFVSYKQFRIEIHYDSYCLKLASMIAAFAIK